MNEPTLEDVMDTPFGAVYNLVFMNMEYLISALNNRVAARERLLLGSTVTERVFTCGISDTNNFSVDVSFSRGVCGLPPPEDHEIVCSNIYFRQLSNGLMSPTLKWYNYNDRYKEHVMEYVYQNADAGVPGVVIKYRFVFREPQH